MIFILFVVAVFFIMIRALVRVKKSDALLRNTLKEVDKQHSMVVVVHNGIEVPMTYIQKVTLWDKMSQKERTDMAKRMKHVIDKGKARPEELRSSGRNVPIFR